MTTFQAPLFGTRLPPKPRSQARTRPPLPAKPHPARKATKPVPGYTPIFRKAVYQHWIRTAQRVPGYAAQGQVERWRDAVRQWDRIEREQVISIEIGGDR